MWWALSLELYPNHLISFSLPKRGKTSICPCVLSYTHFLDEETEAQVIFLKSQSDRSRTGLNPGLQDSRGCSHNHFVILPLNNPSLSPVNTMPRHNLLKDKPWAASLGLCILTGIQTPINLLCLGLQPDLGDPR